MVKRKLSVVKRIRAAASLLLFCMINELCNGIGLEAPSYFDNHLSRSALW